ncbi:MULTISPECIES: isocitrate/isopropylmalate dehydrogenase family protein [Mesorhizobium]|uniref:3-isopropylmalate dehydrogenase n=5 Tax=Mesorhizobium TaxID=68287 RepID=A0AB38TI15_9HYPH|nr:MULTISPECIES: isocitrate/isopropylmalate dehydrogenase family protein [Mesorhizobium]RWN92277.1 MAG: isocitrate/isopropylmalate dehydrogenase family protein [Mesorhizobium sp.]MDF3212168.1 isocitrate/isopropylmalate dehydrogenase family protein [Mesorhizobium ciceri]RUU80186.1 isocitrate/isopropylmalate dehydrogenase family protein [Mesorhizobium sp. M7A.F.Ca.MR.362.00.0.0]RUY60971.1 isocitrate/isopropylmalate dehydrogenase family protein [Mesorhizobium sp. M7A.F.Ca.CA.001.13.1.1]RUY69442.1
MRENSFRLAIMPGDGIGVEVMEAATAVLEAIEKRHDIGFKMERVNGGARQYQETGVAMTEEGFEAAERADAILFGAMGSPDIRHPDGTEPAPQLDMRFRMKLYAGLRPIRAIPGVPLALASPRASEIDFALVRESTEGLFASRGKGIVTDDKVATDTMRITRDVTERVSHFSFKLAERRARRRKRKGTVTLIDKSNVFRSFAFMRKIFFEVASQHPDVTAAQHSIDATALDLIRRPWDFDVMVTENMFGDILSDLGAGLVGGMGFAPSADIGDDHALFQPCHGTAPDIAGQGIANPVAMILSTAMMLDWLGARHSSEACLEAADEIETAVDAAFGAGSVRPYDIGGSDGTGAIARAIIERLAPRARV